MAHIGFTILEGFSSIRNYNLIQYSAIGSQYVEVKELRIFVSLPGIAVYSDSLSLQRDMIHSRFHYSSPGYQLQVLSLSIFSSIHIQIFIKEIVKRLYIKMTRPNSQLKVLSRKTSRFQGYRCESENCHICMEDQVKLSLQSLKVSTFYRMDVYLNLELLSSIYMYA